MTTLTPFLNKIIEKKDLTETESKSAMEIIMSGSATPSQISGFLVALRMKGESSSEIAGCASAMREAATSIKGNASVIADSCGTGGDKSGTLNISTAAFLVAAGAGITMAKHGNRAVSSSCGSADVLEELGVKIDAQPKTAEKCLNMAGLTFLFAPIFHPAMKNVMPTRRELGVRTVFNILGPLTNPAGANVQLLGVYDPSLMTMMADVLKRLGTRSAWIVHSKGLDEISLESTTQVTELSRKKIRSFEIHPENFGLEYVKRKDILGSSRKENAHSILQLLSGQKGPLRQVVLANAAAIIYLSNENQNISDLKTAVKKAEQAIDSGTAQEKLNSLIKISHSTF